MELQTKLQVLAAAAKYDVSCSSSGSKRTNSSRGVGNAAYAGICHSWSEDGRCISLLKILFSNDCIYDCAYCANRSSNDIQRATFTPEEVVELTINFYRRNYIEGLFLSSGIVKNKDFTMEQLLKTAKLLRETYQYNGYIHLKTIPGADPGLIRQAGLYADRMSVNVELPTSDSLKLLAPQKTQEAIYGSMGTLSQNILENSSDKKRFRKTPQFVPAGQSTQMIVGATPENDYHIVKLSESLYQKFSLKRVYYSGYIPVNNDSRLPVLAQTPPLLREHRLYQADWLMRFYHFRADEILDQDNPNLDADLDPKACWAVRHPEQFPIEINKASYEVLLRVPGLGVRSAKRIVMARRFRALDFNALKKLGVVLKRAQFFITCNGRSLEQFDLEPAKLKIKLLEKKNTIHLPNYQQLSLFVA